MLYQKTLTVPANTPATAPVETTLELTVGTSTLREVVFHDGCHGLVHVQVWDAGWQLMPWNRDAWLAADGETVVDESPYPVLGPDYAFTMFAYNEDTVNDHEVQLRVIMREGETEEFLNLGQFLEALRGM